MSVQHRLKMILEGHSGLDNNPLMENVEYYPDELALFSESMKADFEYIAGIGFLTESDGEGKTNVFKRIIDWIVQKINSFIAFIKNLFSKKTKEVDSLIKNVERLAKIDSVTPNTSAVTFKKLLDSPEDSISIFQEHLGKVTEEVNSLIAMIKDGKLPEELKDSTDSKDYSRYIYGKIFSGRLLRTKSGTVSEVSEFFAEMYGKEEKVDINIRTDLKAVEKLLTIYYKSESNFTKNYENIKRTLEGIQERVNKGSIKADEQTAHRIRFACTSLIAIFNGIVVNMNNYVRAYETALAHIVEQNK